MAPIQPKTLCICVYCGSHIGTQQQYGEAGRLLGRLMAERGWELVYGGGRVGLMGAVADAAMNGGGTVVGIIPQALMDREAGHQGVTELLVVQTMHQRKHLMAARADAFIALPGGIGTFEELFETWSWRELGYHNKPIALLNVAGYYDGLLSFIDHAVAHRFMSVGQRAQVIVADQVPALLDTLAALIPPSPMQGDYSSI